MSNLKKIEGGVTTPQGFTAGAVYTAIKKRENKKPDVAVLYSDLPCSCAACFTTNKFCAAPVILDREILKKGKARAVVINSGNANAATGKQVWRTNRFKVRESFGRSADGKTVYAKTMDGLLIAVEPGKPEFTLRGQCDLKFGYEHAPCPVLEANGVVYAGSRSGVIAAVDAATGALLWTYKVGTTSVNSFTDAPSGDVYATLLEGKIVRISRQ